MSDQDKNSKQNSMRGSRGGTEGPDPTSLKSHKHIGFLSNTGPDPLENHKATKPAFNVRPSSARQRNAKWRLVGEPMMINGVFYSVMMSVCRGPFALGIYMINGISMMACF